MDLQEILAKHQRGETLSQAEMDFLTENQGTVDPSSGSAITAESSEMDAAMFASQEQSNQSNQALNKNAQAAINIGDYMDKAMGGNDLTFGDPNISKQRPSSGATEGTVNYFEPSPIDPLGGQSPINPEQPKMQDDSALVGAYQDMFNVQKSDDDTGLDIPSMDVDLSGAGGVDQDYSDVQSPAIGGYEDRMSRAALLANQVGAGIGTDSAAYLFGRALGGKGSKGLTGGKLGLALGRGILGGASGVKREGYVDDYYEKQQRKASQGRSREVSQANDDRGGSWVGAEDGGTFSAKEKAFVTELAQYMNGGKKKGKINLSYEDGGETQSGYSAGDKITFKDSKGKVISGVIKGFKDGEIILED